MTPVRIARKLADVYKLLGYHVTNVTRDKVDPKKPYMFFVDDRNMARKPSFPTQVLVFSNDQVEFEGALAAELHEALREATK